VSRWVDVDVDVLTKNTSVEIKIKMRAKKNKNKNKKNKDKDKVMNKKNRRSIAFRGVIARLNLNYVVASQHHENQNENPQR